MRGVFRRGRSLVAVCLLAAVIGAAVPASAGVFAPGGVAAACNPEDGEPSWLELLAEWFEEFSRISVPGG